MNNKVSKEIQDEAIRLAKSTQKRALTKDERKLITQGIEKGIAEYKKQQKAKSRERDKIRKIQTKEIESNVAVTESMPKSSNLLPWALLVVSWLGFILYLFLPEKN